MLRPFIAVLLCTVGAAVGSNSTQYDCSASASHAALYATCLATIPCRREASNLKTVNNVQRCITTTDVYGTIYPRTLRKINDKAMESTILMEVQYYWYDPAMSDIVVEKFTEWEPAWQIMNAVDDPDYIIEATTEYLEETPLAAAHFIDRSVTVNMVMVSLHPLPPLRVPCAYIFEPTHVVASPHIGSIWFLVFTLEIAFLTTG